jgi:hypothetical protein
MKVGHSVFIVPETNNNNNSFGRGLVSLVITMTFNDEIIAELLVKLGSVNGDEVRQYINDLIDKDLKINSGRRKQNG